MRIVFMGTPDFAVPCLQKLIDEKHEIVGVFSQPDKPQGRKMVLKAPPVKELALQHNLPVFQPETLKNGAAAALLTELAPDLIVVVAYGKILPPYVLNAPKKGCINVHGSLLPRWRGAAPIQWAVLAGDQTTGVTVMRMDEGLDTGNMLLKAETEIGAHETAGELFDRLSLMGADLLADAVRILEMSDPVGEKQEDGTSCYAFMLDKEMANIDWTKSAREIDCLVRGLNPWPVAQTTIGGDKLRVFTVLPVERTGEPGEVLTSEAKTGLVVACGEGALELIEIQAVGGKRMAAKDYLRGHAITVGTKLGN